MLVLRVVRGGATVGMLASALVALMPDAAFPWHFGAVVAAAGIAVELDRLLTAADARRDD